jgi:DNA-binding IclR family transcriptional regulator
MAGHADGRPSAYRERNSTADRALDILALFDDDRLVIGGQEVADQLGVARSTAYRYLQSLVSSGFIEEQRPSGYRLGPRVLELARLARKGIGLSEVARPVMRELVAEVGETVLLTRRTGTAVVCLERESTDRPARLSYERGHILPVNAGASALVLLAWAPQEEIESLIRESGLPRLTDATVTDAELLWSRLKEIRARGYALSRGELDPDVVGIAAPIREESGAVTAALSVAALTHHIPDERVAEVAAAVDTAARKITCQLALIGS